MTRGRDIPVGRRLDELLADRATQTLTAPEHRELVALLERAPGTDAQAYERAAAAVALSSLPDEGPMPARLRRRVEEGAIAWLAASGRLEGA